MPGAAPRSGPADLTLDDFYSRDRAMQRCLELARMAAGTDLPVLILTVHDDPVYQRTARAAGADGFVVKKTAGTALWPTLMSLVPTGRCAGPEPTLWASG